MSNWTKGQGVIDLMRKDGFNPPYMGEDNDQVQAKIYDYIMWLRDQAHIDLPEGMMRGSYPEDSEPKGYT